MSLISPSPNTFRPGSRAGELAVLGVIAIGLLAAVIWLVGAQGVAEPAESVGSSLDTGPRGTLALYRWLGQSGFDVARTGAGDTFPPDADTLIMANPDSNFPEGQARLVRRWVEAGHTLVLALGDTDYSLDTGGVHPMLAELGADLTFSSPDTDTMPLSQPVFARPPVQQVVIPSNFSLLLPLTNTVVLASTGESAGFRDAMAAVMTVGQGRVFLLAGIYPLTNEGLKEPSNGQFVYNMVQSAGGRRVAFDEAHHGQSTGGDLLALLTSTPWGWALIYGAVLAALFFVWSARRLGPPLPVPTPDRRRPTADYVTSVANLFRRARKPGYVAERYLRYFKRTFSRYAELDPYLTDQNFVASLGERGRHAFNQEAMARAIARLRGLEGNATGSERTEEETLKALREAERVRQEALGVREEGEQSK